jgi:hypothetical protein
LTKFLKHWSNNKRRILLGTVFAVVLLVWIRSYWVEDRLRFFPRVPSGWAYRIEFQTTGGSFSIDAEWANRIWNEDAPYFAFSSEPLRRPVTYFVRPEDIRSTVFGFGILHDSVTEPYPITMRAVCMPMWAVALPVAACFFIKRFRIRKFFPSKADEDIHNAPHG